MSLALRAPSLLEHSQRIWIQKEHVQLTSGAQYKLIRDVTVRNGGASSDNQTELLRSGF